MNNWSGDAAPYVGIALQFGALNGGSTTNNNDFAAGTQFSGIAFTSAAPSYTLQGNAINLAGPLQNSSSFSQTVGLNIALAAGGGTLDSGTAGLTVSGAISGSGSLTKISAGALILTGANSYSGSTTINNGSLQVGGGGSLGNTAIGVANGAMFAPMPGGGAVVAGSTGLGTACATLNLGSGAVLNMVDGGIGTLSLNQQSGFVGTALTLSGATLKLELSSSGADSLLVNQGTATMSGTNTVSITSLGNSLTPGSTYTLISAPSGLNGTLLFPNSSTSESLTVGGTPYNLTLNSSGTAETIHVSLSLTSSYQLAATAANSTIIQGGTTTVVSSILNLGSTTLNYSGLAVSLTPSGGSLGGLPQSGTGLLPTNSSSVAYTFTSNVPGTATLSPIVSLVTDTSGGSASSSVPAAAMVTVLGHAARSLSVAAGGNNQTVIVGAVGITAGLNLSNGTLNQGGLAALDVNSLGTLVIGPTGGKLLASGSSQPYTALLSTGTLGAQVQILLSQCRR